MRRLAFLVLIILIVSGCNKRTPITALPPVTSSPVVPETQPVPLPAPARAATTPLPEPPAYLPLEEPDRAYHAGNFPEAARGYEAYLAIQPTGDQRDQALFRLAMTHVLTPGNSDWPKAAALLRQLLEEHPDSLLKAPANIILTLQSELVQANGEGQKREQRIKQLNTELEKLKQIDADRRKRP